MLLFRILCAILMAWAVNWSLARPEAAGLMETVPEMAVFGPIAGVFAGFFNLSVRQGWGVVVGFANGIWAGAMAILISGGLYTAISLAQAFRGGLVYSVDAFVTIFGDTVEPLLEQIADLPLLIVSLGAAAIVGVVTEFLHWLLVRFRRRRTRTRLRAA